MCSGHMWLPTVEFLARINSVSRSSLGDGYGAFLSHSVIGVPKSSNFIGLSIINHPAIGLLPFTEIPIYQSIRVFLEPYVWRIPLATVGLEQVAGVPHATLNLCQIRSIVGKTIAWNWDTNG